MSGAVIRPAAAADAAGIARVFIESAEHHAALDPARYFVPDAQSIVERYREGRQHAARSPEEVVTLVAILEGKVVGFVDARLDRPLDAMHRDLLYCSMTEIAVAASARSKGVGGRLVEAAEAWGRARGAELACLDYLVANTRAATFYCASRGYRAVSAIAVRLGPAS